MNSTKEKLVYNVEDIQELLGIGRSKAYKLVRSGAFPVRRVDNRILIPKFPFLEWLNNPFNDIST